MNGSRPRGPANILGVRVDALDLESLVILPQEFVARGGRYTIMYANVHTLNTAYTDPDCRRILNQADVVYCDGAGVVLGAKLLGHSLPGRMTGADWVYPFCEKCTSGGLSLYLLGGKPGVAEQAGARLRELYPDLHVVGTYHGYLEDPDVCAAAVAAVNAAQPRILLVGMGTPTQEKWLAAHRAALEVPVCWAVGALYDYVAGVVPRGPRWMLDHGLEWLYRLWLEPGRLGYRYLVGNPLFFIRVLRQRMSRRKEPLS